MNTRCRRWRAEQTFAHWLSQHNPAPSNTDSSASSADGPVSRTGSRVPPVPSSIHGAAERAGSSLIQSHEDIKQTWRVPSQLTRTVQLHAEKSDWHILDFFLLFFKIISRAFKPGMWNSAKNALFTPNTLWRLRGRYRGCCACVGTLDNPVTLTGQSPSFLFCQEYILWQDAITTTKVKANVFRLS